MRWGVLPVVWTSACVLSSPQWQDARDDAVCRVTVTCFDSHADHATCVEAAAEGEEPPCVAIRYGASWQCLRELRAQAKTCPDSVADWQVPTVCALVCYESRDERAGL